MFKDLKPSEIILPILLTGLFPLLALVSGSEEWQTLTSVEQVSRWIVMSSFLLIIWFANLFIKRGDSRTNYLIRLIGINIVLVLSFSIVITYSFQDLATPSEAADSSFIRIIRPGIAAGLILIFQFSLRSSRDNARLKNENLALQAESYKAELEQLRKQVNPHFLFNSLSTLRTIIRDQNNADKAEQFLLSLSDVYRQILQTRESDRISLKEELEFLSSYIYLLQIRFGDALDISVESFKQSEQYSLPAFGLQLLVENCIKHNIVSNDEPLSVRIFQQNEESISVSNNYNPKLTPTESLGTGLSNLSKRYALVGFEHGVEVDQSEETFTVTLKLF